MNFHCMLLKKANHLGLIIKKITIKFARDLKNYYICYRGSGKMTGGY